MKINTLEEAKAYSIGICEKFPEDKDRSDLTSPLANVEALKAAIPGLPQNYCDVARQVALKGKIVGYFSLWPEAFNKSTLEESLVEANSDKSPFVARFREIGAYHVAGYEAEPIGVVGEAKFNQGEVFKLDISGSSLSASKLASSFEEFLLIAASLDKAQMEDQGEGASRSFLKDVQKFASEEIAENWRVICEVAFGC
jgi:hypothetical protein